MVKVTRTLIDKAKYDKTYRGIIKEIKNVDGKYYYTVVLNDNDQVVIKGNGKNLFEQNETVNVVFPQNNKKNAYFVKQADTGEEKPFIIPLATSNVVGGIKADLATEDDTQPVRIREDGKLVTKSTGGGSGVTNHSDLAGRDISDQHPIKAITGLENTLQDKELKCVRV